MSVEGGDCDAYTIRHVNDDQQYIIEWNGGAIPSFCSFGFIGRDSGYQNEYKVCIEATTYRVSDCNVEMKYEIGISDILQEVYTHFLHTFPLNYIKLFIISIMNET